jgi:hypothetical protein
MPKRSSATQPLYSKVKRPPALKASFCLALGNRLSGRRALAVKDAKSLPSGSFVRHCRADDNQSRVFATGRELITTPAVAGAADRIRLGTINASVKMVTMARGRSGLPGPVRRRSTGGSVAPGRAGDEPAGRAAHRGPCRDPERHRHCPGLWRGEITSGGPPQPCHYAGCPGQAWAAVLRGAIAASAIARQSQPSGDPKVTFR